MAAPRCSSSVELRVGNVLALFSFHFQSAHLTNVSKIRGEMYLSFGL
jgi:hypothetical protein